MAIGPTRNDLRRLQNSKTMIKRARVGAPSIQPIPITTFPRYFDDQYPLFSVHGTSLPNITNNPVSIPTDPRGRRLILLYNTPFGNASTYYNTTEHQFYRLQQKENPWITNNLPVSTIIEHTSQDKPIIHKGAGEDVDLVIIDDGVWHGHVEFGSNVVNAKNPRDYRSGNALRDIPNSGGSDAICGILDIYLDGPAYLDPDFFYNPANLERTIVRWDGTRLPACSAASDWWNTNSLSARSSKFVSPANGGTATGDDDFGNIYYNLYDDKKFNTASPLQGLSANDGSRLLFNGVPTLQSSDAGHGTPVASLAYGRTQGWGYNANKWSLSYGSGRGSDVESIFDLMTVFHKVKSNHKKKPSYI